MERTTIFGEEHFIDKTMVTICEEIKNQQDALLVNEIYKESINIGFNIDKAKLEKWLRLCIRLENIDNDTLIDFAIQKKFADLKQKNEMLKSKLNQAKEHLISEIQKL